MRQLLILLAVIFCLSCNERTKASAKEAPKVAKSYEQLKEEHLVAHPNPDTTFLGFVLRSSPKEVQNHLTRLIAANKIQDRSTLRFEMINSKIEGYPYTIQLTPSTTVTTLMDTEMFNDQLLRVTLMPYGEHEDPAILEFLTKKYGQPVHHSKSNDYGDLVYHWLKDGYEIKYDAAVFGLISFSDLSLQTVENKALNTLDSLLNENKKAAAEESSKDFR